MGIFVNGESREVDGGQTIADLIDLLEVPSDQKGIAVAHNQTVLPQSQWARTQLETDDAIEIIRAVQGG